MNKLVKDVTRAMAVDMIVDVSGVVMRFGIEQLFLAGVANKCC